MRLGRRTGESGEIGRPLLHPRLEPLTPRAKTGFGGSGWVRGWVTGVGSGIEGTAGLAAGKDVDVARDGGSGGGSADTGIVLTDEAAERLDDEGDLMTYQMFLDQKREHQEKGIGKHHQNPGLQTRRGQWICD